MPIEIKELNIRVNITSTGAGSSDPSLSSQDNLEREKIIVAHCVEQVMEILKHKMER